MQAFFSVLVGAFALGQAAPSSEALSTALGSAGAIFDAIKRVSELLPHNHSLTLVVETKSVCVCVRLKLHVKLLILC